ncbi:TonB-dependent receptor [Minicystis rosea]|nr:TonB-dependent receptor [Minicystis rosea]
MIRARLLAALFVLCTAGSARADDPAPLVEARAAFVRGTDLAKDAQWGAALASFERSAKLRPHPWTTYNIAICERALGQYVRARRSFAQALRERTASDDLPDATVADARRFAGEIDGLVGALDVTLEPKDASITIDGQPLEPAGSDDPSLGSAASPLLVAGTLPAGPGKPPPAESFRVLLDPGAHVIVVSRPGFTDAVARESVRPGDRRALKLVVERMPATIVVSANEANAVVTVDHLDVGVAPVSLLRPAGVHHVVVRKRDFDPYEVNVNAAAGQRVDLAASLKPHRPSVLTRWWFWTAAAAVVTGVVVTTYVATRPDPQRPPIDGGGLGWAVRVP